MNIKIPKLCLVVLIGPSGSGKTMFARRHFCPRRCSRPTPAGAWSGTTRTIRRSRTTHSRCCISSPASGLPWGV